MANTNTFGKEKQAGFFKKKANGTDAIPIAGLLPNYSQQAAMFGESEQERERKKRLLNKASFSMSRAVGADIDVDTKKTPLDDVAENDADVVAPRRNMHVHMASEKSGDADDAQADAGRQAAQEPKGGGEGDDALVRLDGLALAEVRMTHTCTHTCMHARVCVRACVRAPRGARACAPSYRQST